MAYSIIRIILILRSCQIRNQSFSQAANRFRLSWLQTIMLRTKWGS